MSEKELLNKIKNAELGVVYEIDHRVYKNFEFTKHEKCGTSEWIADLVKADRYGLDYAIPPDSFKSIEFAKINFAKTLGIKNKRWSSIFS